jgi:hypothetical protein
VTVMEGGGDHAELGVGAVGGVVLAIVDYRRGSGGGGPMLGGGMMRRLEHRLDRGRGGLKGRPAPKDRGRTHRSASVGSRDLSSVNIVGAHKTSTSCANISSKYMK